jgi:hypothetical protein
MRGHYVVDLGNNTQTDVPIGPFDLTGFHGSAVKRQPPDIAQGPELLRELDLYIAECELLGSALLDTDRLPDTLRWPFQRLFLGQGKVTVFNSVKHGKFTKVDIRRALVLLYLVPKDFVTPLEKNYRLEYNDICLYGDGFDSLRVVLFYLKKPFTQVLTKWGVPERLHAEVAADIERLAKERAKAAQRPKWDERDRYAELRDLSSPEFLRRVYGDEIGEDGSIQKEVVRKIDAKLMAAVETYISAREGRRRDMGDAEGLHLIAGVRSRSKRAHLG